MLIVDVLIRAGLLLVLFLVIQIVWSEARRFHEAGLQRLDAYNRRQVALNGKPLIHHQ